MLSEVLGPRGRFPKLGAQEKEGRAIGPTLPRVHGLRTMIVFDRICANEIQSLIYAWTMMIPHAAMQLM